MRNFLENTELFKPEEIEHFLSFGTESCLPKGSCFITEGEVAKKVAFVKTGLLR